MMDRRTFLQGSAAATALALAGCRRQAGPTSANAGRVFIAAADDYKADLFAMIDAGLANFPNLGVKGKTVLLKPNLVETTATERPINTHPAVVVAAAEAFRRAGAAKIIVADGPGHRRDIELVLAQCGLGRALKEAHLEFVDLNHDSVATVQNRGGMTQLSHLHFAHTVAAADVVVSLAKMKTHHWAGVTLAMKNCFGLMPGLVYGWPKNVLHWQGIERSIVDIVATARPAFGIVDGIIGMEGDGPLMGVAKKVGCLVMSDQLASLDATCATIMGFDPVRISYINELARRGFGATNVAAIQQVGESIARFQTKFDVLPQFRELLAIQ